MDLEAAVTIIGEGPRGHLYREICEKLNLDEESQPQVYELGCKEVLELPSGSVTEGEVMLTMGWPLQSNTFGGAFSLHPLRRPGLYRHAGGAGRRGSRT